MIRDYMNKEDIIRCELYLRLAQQGKMSHDTCAQRILDIMLKYKKSGHDLHEGDTDYVKHTI